MWIHQGASGMAEILFFTVEVLLYTKIKHLSESNFLIYILFAITILHTVSNKSLFLANKLY